MDLLCMEFNHKDMLKPWNCSSLFFCKKASPLSNMYKMYLEKNKFPKKLSFSVNRFFVHYFFCINDRSACKHMYMYKDEIVAYTPVVSSIN